jgi:hypothetical protein
VRFEEKTMNCGELIILTLCIKTSFSGYLSWLTRKHKKQDRPVALTKNKINITEINMTV